MGDMLIDIDLCRKAGIQTHYEDVWGKEQIVPQETIEYLFKAMGCSNSTYIPDIYVVKADGEQEISYKGQTLSLPKLPIGYHIIPQGIEKIFVIAAPDRCWLPEDLRQGKRIWGLSTQLYGLRSQHNLGIGDFTDLANLAKKAAAYGADVIGINPVHAAFVNDMTRYSPYSPNNRQFLNFLYIDVTDKEKSFAYALDDSNFVDYAAVGKAKLAALKERFTAFKGDLDFDAFKTERGAALHKQALYDALSEYFTEIPEYMAVDSSESERFARDHEDKITFYTWLQWLADRQLKEAQTAALNAGMTIGLYRDLAVGSGGNSAELWINPHDFVQSISVGAPPDEYNRKGQNWGLPPFNPIALRQKHMQPFIDLIRANMRHARALRIDHAFGLSRLFWIPNGEPAAKGAYVTYPLEAMLAVLRVESHLNQCLVIGEDMGTFPPGYKEAAAASGLLSYRLLYFEREQNGDFIQPENYPAHALTAISTHDLPTFAGWQSGWDIDLKQKLDLYPKPGMAEEDREGRKQDQIRLENAFKAQNLPEINMESAQIYLARSPAMIVMVQLEDLVGIQEQANMPGTIYEHPNWRRKLPVDLNELFNATSALAKLAPQMKAARAKPFPAHPLATYRLQLHAGFTFYDAANIVPYLTQLGISHIYASPYFQARTNSTHGYDVIDHNRFNEELGGKEGYTIFLEALRENGLRHILDFVPNHMGIGNGNPWWQDVLMHGENSAFADFFDIDWQEKLLLPVLGKPLEEVLAAGELTLEENTLCYFEHRFPLCPETPRNASIKEIVRAQHYRLAHWKQAPNDINYRRFFEINDLAGVAVEKEHVFNAVHKLAFSLVYKGELAGLRIDHIDGLADPAGYLRKLHECLGPNFYLIVEKILASDEQLPESWPVSGTSGYDVLADINNLFIDSHHEPEFTQIYQAYTGKMQSMADVIADAKRMILKQSFISEINALVKDKTNDFKLALEEVIVHFPVYRTYISDKTSGQDKRFIREAIEKVRADGDHPAYDLLEKQLLNGGDPEFIRKFQQLTGPAMAKGCEDTGFYRYNRFISLNEVGSDPAYFGMPADRFHKRVITRQQDWPQNLIATATHDTKRGEDMRARLNVLSETPDRWEAVIGEWDRIYPSPLSANDRYFFYQTLVGSWPVELLEEPLLLKKELENYEKRLSDYMVKALRESKENSHWLEPNERYEEAAVIYIHGLLYSERFLESFLPWLAPVTEAGLHNSLAQLVLKLTLPGVPDIYQGSERWDFSLVDPDNRRPVNYMMRETGLSKQRLWTDGAIKQSLMTKLLNHRQKNRALYGLGTYIPLTTDSTHWMAYARQIANKLLIVGIPRFHYHKHIGKLHLTLPENLPDDFSSILTEESFLAKDGKLEIESRLPVVLESSL